MIATGDHEEEVNKRIAQVKAEGQATDSEFDREKAEERVAKLGGAIGRIKVGAATETELKDKKLRYEDALLDWVTPQSHRRLNLTRPIPLYCRYEDALNSVKAAMDEGIVPGGGSTLVYMLRYKQQILDAMESDDEKLAVDILFRAIQVRLWSRPTSGHAPHPLLSAPPLTPPPLSRANPVPDQPDRLQRRRGGRARPREGEGQGVWVRLERRQRRVRRPLRDGRDRPGDGDAAGDHQLVLDRGVGAHDQLPDHRDSRGGAADDGRRRRRPDGRHAWHVDSDDGETYHPATSCLSPPFPPARRPHPLRAETRGLRPKLHSRA